MGIYTNADASKTGRKMGPSAKYVFEYRYDRGTLESVPSVLKDNHINYNDY